MKIVAKNIVVLGAGFAGVLTAKKLAKRLKEQDDVRITLIDKHPYHTMLTELHEVAANRVVEHSIRISLKRIFAGRRVDVRLDTVTSIDFDKKVLTAENASYPYDYLVLASGSKPSFYGTPGAEEFSYKLWSYEDALKLRAHIIDMFQRAVSETNPEAKRKLLTFFIVGAGFTGVETAGELAEWMPILCDEFEIDRELVRIFDVDMLERIVPVFPQRIAEKAARRLKKMGVSVVLKVDVSALGNGFIEFRHGDKLTRENTATVIWTAGIEGSEIAQKSDSLKQAGRARIQTDEFLRAKGRSDVFVAGDNIFYIPEGEKAPVPQMVENCEESADTIAHNLTVAITENGSMEKYRPKFHGAMLSIGGRYGVAYVGTEKSKISLASFFAMFVKHAVYVIYFVQILGWNKVFSYVHHEFFTIRNRRSFVGGHFSNRTPSFLLVPLRVFYGAFWIYEAVEKIGQGWLAKPKLAAYFKSAADLFNSVLKSPAAGDATSSATKASGTVSSVPAGSLILNWNILGIFRVIVINTSDFAIKIQSGIMDWFNRVFLLQSNGSQVFFQWFIVFSELLIGALLILGLFTFIASGYSLVLQVMFVMTTGMYLSTWWMVFAAIALLIGAGRTFGLDYYVMPCLKKHWKNVKFARKLYIYND
jgi:NADH dehydrogenase